MMFWASTMSSGPALQQSMIDQVLCWPTKPQAMQAIATHQLSASPVMLNFRVTLLRLKCGVVIWSITWVSVALDAIVNSSWSLIGIDNAIHGGRLCSM